MADSLNKKVDYYEAWMKPMNIVRDRFRHRMEMLDVMAAAFITQTGLDPEQCELVEQQHADGSLTWHFRRRITPFIDHGGVYQVHSYTKDEKHFQSLEINDVFGDFVVLRNDRPDGVDGDGYLTLQRRTTTPHVSRWFKAKGYIPAGSAVTTSDVVGMKQVRAGDEVAPGVIAIGEKEHGAIHSLIREPLSPELKRTLLKATEIINKATANKPECRCPSLLNGHEAGCPAAK